MTSSLQLRVHIFILHKMSCRAGLIPFAQAWRLVDYDRFHLVIHSAFHGGEPGKAQCEAVVQAIQGGGISKQRHYPEDPSPTRPGLPMRQDLLGGSGLQRDEVDGVLRCHGKHYSSDIVRYHARGHGHAVLKAAM